ncbi:hypothetical protein SCG7086_AI_00080 [Chlamydiales bacterium SCGC AG-110-P3]|nr:hypothetical protein SCG7086_AI_00080 [Chlamydiales bacterium SCGC AG-110-P3]
MKTVKPNMFNYPEYLRSKAEAELSPGLLSIEALKPLLSPREHELYGWCRNQKELRDKIWLEGFPATKLKVDFTKEDFLLCLYRIERESKQGFVETVG